MLCVSLFTPTFTNWFAIMCRRGTVRKGREVTGYVWRTCNFLHGLNLHCRVRLSQSFAWLNAFVKSEVGRPVLYILAYLFACYIPPSACWHATTLLCHHMASHHEFFTCTEKLGEWLQCVTGLNGQCLLFVSGKFCVKICEFFFLFPQKTNKIRECKLN